MLTDYQMPDMDGFELTMKVREHWDKTQLTIIGLSAVGHSDLGSMFIKNGANDFLPKPFSYQELLCRINQNIEMLEYIETVHNIANRDYLTQLYNRRYFFIEGEQLFQQAENNELTLVTVMIDIDHFKQVNDKYGHDCGDEVLVQFAQLLSKHFKHHLVARLGGEEFAMLLKNIQPSQINACLEAFRLDVELLTPNWQSQEVPITTSIGYNSQFISDIDAMLKVADDNLYLAKTHGRNRVEGD